MLKKIFLIALFSLFVFGNELDDLINKCENNDSEACLDAGLLYDKLETDENKKNDLQKRVFQKSCDLGRGIGCFNLYSIYVWEKDFEVAKQILEKSCNDLKYPTSCMELGFIYKNGKYGLDKDLKRAKYYYKRGCKFGSKLSCNYAKEL